MNDMTTLTTPQRVYLPFKRLFDIIFSIAALIALMPMFLIVAVAVKLDSEGQVIYPFKMRAGRNGKPFTMYKFRSMVNNAHQMQDSLRGQNEMDEPVFKMKNDPRITKVGRVIRKYSIDETPQFLNVLLGQMSIVGPRPPLVSEYEKYEPWQKSRLDVKPGITCYWQVGGRNKITSFDKWVEMDLKYIKEMGPLTDLIIVFKTIPAVLSGDGAY